MKINNQIKELIKNNKVYIEGSNHFKNVVELKEFESVIIYFDEDKNTATTYKEEQGYKKILKIIKKNKGNN